ncbi:hypothetical protein HanIR_Chr10g0488231 [Helianthus annuus]|nr:hypothetical protein HanIR_Chr10g0488231 [Helianthus annuus]
MECEGYGYKCCVGYITIPHLIPKTLSLFRGCCTGSACIRASMTAHKSTTSTISNLQLINMHHALPSQSAQ